MSNDVYLFQRGDENHVQDFVRLRGSLLAWRGTDGRKLEFHTSLRWKTDLADKNADESQLFVYDTYARCSGLLPRSVVTVGRQFVYSGAGSALIDGGRITYRPSRKSSLEFFTGSSVSSTDPEDVRSIGDYLVMGTRAGLRVSGSARAELDWLLRKREGQTSFHRASLDALYLYRNAELFGQMSYDLADLRVAEFRGRVVYRPHLWYFSAEYTQREPYVPSNSIFAIINFDRYNLARFEARRRVWKSWSVISHLRTDLREDETTWTTGLGIAGEFFSLQWIHQTGYGGKNDGISGNLNLPVGSSLVCYATAHLYQYRIQTQLDDRLDSYAWSAGVEWRTAYDLSVRAEGQYLRNAVYEDDTRFFLRVAKDFSAGSKSKGGQQ